MGVAKDDDATTGHDIAETNVKFTTKQREKIEIDVSWTIGEFSSRIRNRETVSYEKELDLDRFSESPVAYDSCLIFADHRPRLILTATFDAAGLNIAPGVIDVDDDVRVGVDVFVQSDSGQRMKMIDERVAYEELLSPSNSVPSAWVNKDSLFLRCLATLTFESSECWALLDRGAYRLDDAGFDLKSRKKNRIECMNILSNVLSAVPTDVVLRVEGKKVSAHKTVLAEHSGVIAAMVRANSKFSEIEIEDVSLAAVKEFKVFCYTGEVPNVSTLSEELLLFCDSYAIETLARLLDGFMARRLTVGGAVRSLLLADCHKREDLRARCLTFIVKNHDGVFATEAWQKMREFSRELYDEVTEKVAEAGAQGNGDADSEGICAHDAEENATNNSSEVDAEGVMSDGRSNADAGFAATSMPLPNFGSIAGFPNQQGMPAGNPFGFGGQEFFANNPQTMGFSSGMPTMPVMPGMPGMPLMADFNRWMQPSMPMTPMHPQYPYMQTNQQIGPYQLNSGRQVPNMSGLAGQHGMHNQTGVPGQPLNPSNPLRPDGRQPPLGQMPPTPAASGPPKINATAQNQVPMMEGQSPFTDPRINQIIASLPPIPTVEPGTFVQNQNLNPSLDSIAKIISDHDKFMRSLIPEESSEEKKPAEGRAPVADSATPKKEPAKTMSERKIERIATMPSQDDKPNAPQKVVKVEKITSLEIKNSDVTIEAVKADDDINSKKEKSTQKSPELIEQKVEKTSAEEKRKEKDETKTSSNISMERGEVSKTLERRIHTEKEKINHRAIKSEREQDEKKTDAFVERDEQEDENDTEWYRKRLKQKKELRKLTEKNES